MNNKSSIEEIKARFNRDVERFSNLDTGQATTIDASLNMEWICSAISRVHPGVKEVLDIGCGAGNYGMKLLEKVNPLQFTLIDLSMAMLDRAKQRIDELNKGSVTCIQGDFRSISLKENSFDVIIATAVLHHLRDDLDWEEAFQKLYRCLKPGGSIWIFDLIQQSNAGLQEYMYHELYGQYLSNLKDDAYRDHVFEYIDKEDSPRPLTYQLNLLTKVGFKEVDIISKKLCFASFVGFK